MRPSVAANLVLPPHDVSVSVGTEPVSRDFYMLVLVLACIGGAMHGVAMAIRKLYGEGKEQYWLEWKWWAGTMLDMCAGLMIWPAMPFVSVHIFAPLIIVIQVCSSFVMGLILFHEKCIVQRSAGLALAVVGILGVSLSTLHQAAHFSIGDFWAAWATIRFLTTLALILVAFSICFMTVQRSTFWGLLAAGFEGIQYICSRFIVDSIFELEAGFLKQPAVWAALIIKGVCISSVLHCQQLGFHSELSQFAAIYCVGCIAFICIFGWAFFGDEMPLSPFFVGSATSTFAGIYLLNQPEEEGDTIAKAKQESH